MIRTKKYHCGDYLEIEVFNVSSRKKPIMRAQRKHETSPAQKKLNSKRRLRYFVRLVNLNFGIGDYSVDMTYDNQHLPTCRADIVRDVKNYIERIRRAHKKRSSAPMKYIYVISNHKGDDTNSTARPHVHMIIGNVDRDIIEEKWTAGYANADRLQWDEYGVTGKALYIARQGRSERCWSSSTNLQKPEPLVSDRAISKSQMERIISDPSDGQFIAKLINKNNKTKYTFTDCLVEYDGRQLSIFDDPGDGNGFSLLIRMRKARHK